MMRITVLDDEPDILHLVTLHLEKAGFSVEGYTDAKGFMHSLNKHKPDLILLDLMLPDADGFEICNSLKKDHWFSAIPIIILSAKGLEADKVIGLDLGADDYITKPFSPRELVARVRAIACNRYSARKANAADIEEMTARTSREHPKKKQ